LFIFQRIVQYSDLHALLCQMWYNGTLASSSIVCSAVICTWELATPSPGLLHTFDLQVHKRINFTEGLPFTTFSSISHSTVFSNSGVFPGCVISATNYYSGHQSMVEGTSMEYTISLNLPPTANVSMNISGGGTYLQPNTANPVAHFAPSDWNTTRSVVLRSTRDDRHTGNQLYSITHTMSTTDLNLHTKQCTLAFNVTNVDYSGLVYSQRIVQVAEGNEVKYNVSLATEPQVRIFLSPTTSRK
jgi:hypothetical protein